MKEEYIAHIKELEKDWDIQTIDEHAEGVASLAGQAASAFHASAWAELCGKWHDLGKYSSEFQQHIKAASGYDLALHDPGKVDHATAGAVFARQLLGQEGLYLPIAYCICGHHAGLHDYDGAGAANLHHHLQETDKMERLPDKLLAQNLPHLPIPNVPREDFPCFWNLWIRMLFSCLVDADSLDTERFMNPEQYASRGQFDDLPVLKERLDRYLRKFEGCAPTLLNRTRAHIQSLCRESGRGAQGIYSLTVPTGGGKTLSSMLWALEHALANGCRRIIIAIPYTSIVVQTASVLKGIFGEDNVVEHHSNADLDSEDDRRGKLATENWDAPIIVTTNVQLFESLYANKRSRCRKLHNIVNSILILDEAQMLPPENLHPIVDVLKSLQKYFGVSILLTSATQPALAGTIGTGKAKFEGMQAKEIMPDTATLFEQLRRVDIQFAQHPYSYDSLARELVTHGQVLCVVNSRRDARMLYDAVNAICNVPVIHLSRMMCQQHIMDRIEEIRDKLSPEHCSPVIVISTQLIEAGVDIDFPRVYRAMAGLDSIAQAAGRCNREGLQHRGQVVVFDFEEARSRGLMRKAAEAADDLIQQGKTDFLDPWVTEEFFRNYYGKLNTTDQAEIKKHLYNLHPAFASAAANFRLIDKEGLTVFVPYGEGIGLIHDLQQGCLSSGLMRRLQRFSVNIPESDKHKILELGGGMIGENLCYLPDEGNYSMDTGLVYDNPFLNNELIL